MLLLAFPTQQVNAHFAAESSHNVSNENAWAFVVGDDGNVLRSLDYGVSQQAQLFSCFRVHIIGRVLNYWTYNFGYRLDMELLTVRQRTSCSRAFTRCALFDI